MSNLTFSFTEIPGQKYVELCAADQPPAPAAWALLAEAIAGEAGLTTYPAEMLANRWRQGYAAIALHHRHIVSYTSMVPVYAAGQRAALGQILKLAPAQLPQIELYEFASGWTQPDYRRRGLSLHLRRVLLAEFNRPDYLQVSIGVGLGASPVLERLGWTLTGWSKIAYTSSLIGLPDAGPGEHRRRGWTPPPGLKPYEGDPITPSEAKDHAWADYCHFWVSNPALARTMNDQLDELMQGNLARWRAAVAAVQTRPSEFGWKLILF